jgi:hypothetical protein
MRRSGLVTLVLVALGGCGEAPPTEPRKVNKIAIANPFHDRLKTLSERDRQLTLRRAVQDAGESCRTIEGSNYSGQYKGLQMWTASCGTGRDYAVFIAASGNVQVRRCEHLEQLGLPACRTG